MRDAPTPGAARAGTDGSARRGRWVLLLVLAAALVAVVALPTWVVAEGSSSLERSVDVRVTGSAVAPQATAAGLVLLAAAAAVALVGRVGRWVVAIVTVGAGLLVCAAAGGVLADPGGAVWGAVAEATGVAVDDPSASLTAWPVVAVVAGVVVVLLGAALTRAGGGGGGGRAPPPPPPGGGGAPP
ncbi:Trp biosynthesis-associated membrane protein, partial [Cellulomonas xiejunii]|uniref:Trp biosynthesis-associated membrane protein n=1 Tax=Cellulomonas xiejunii TaxID=2968083 RepID=UPI001D0F3820